MTAPRPAASAPAARMRLHAAAPQDLDAVGRALAPALGPGDTVALTGPLGAGKSHLARAVIRARLGAPQAEVPSPSYTLVNVYAAGDAEIWHADLYRIADPDELAEIGLADAAHAILLVEWAERWPGLPARRLDIALAPAAGGGRDATVTAHGPGWSRALAALETPA